MMRLPCRHFKCECGFFLCPGERESVSVALHLPLQPCLCVYSMCEFCPFISILCQVLPPSPPPLWTSSSPLQLLSFSSQLAPFSLVTLRALNFHNCCLFLAHSSSPIPTCFTPSILLPYSLYSISCRSPPPSSLSSLLSVIHTPLSLIFFILMLFLSPLSFLSIFFLHSSLLCLPSSERCWRRA